jgi:hypothetical protein
MEDFNKYFFEIFRELLLIINSSIGGNTIVFIISITRTLPLNLIKKQNVCLVTVHSLFDLDACIFIMFNNIFNSNAIEITAVLEENHFIFGTAFGLD